MGRDLNIFSTGNSFLRIPSVIIILLIFIQPKLSAQIVFTKDTLLTGDHTFTQTVSVLDSTVTLTIEGSYILFEAGLTIERGTLIVRSAHLYFSNGSGLIVKTDAEMYATLQSSFAGVNSPGYITMINSKADIYECDFRNIKITTSGRPWFIPDGQWAYRIQNCDLNLTSNDPAPIFNGNMFEIRNCYFWRSDTVGITMGQNYNLSLAGQFGRIENCVSIRGGIESGWASNRNLEIINNTIYNTKVGIYCLGVSKIEYNRIENVDIGIYGGSGGSTRLNNILIENNAILNVSEQAINVEGDSITIHNNTIRGNGETGKGIIFDLSSGSITNNLISDFKISEASFSDEGIALHVFNPQYRKVEINGNIFEYCGLSDIADPEIISSIVYLKSPVIFTGNEFRLNTLGGIAGSLTNFPGGPVLDIVIPYNGVTPVIVNNNFIHSNTFVNDGTYEPTGTKGTLVAAKLENKKLEFSGNILYGSPDASLGIALFPFNFPGGIVGDSLIFEQNTIKNNLVGVGTVAAPDLSNYNNFKDNTSYHIMRYWSQRDPEMFAQNNNWDSGDPVVIDNMLFDDEEGLNTGPINFGGFYNLNYDVTVTNPGTQQLNQGDSLEITIRVTDEGGNPVANLPAFFTSSDAAVVRMRAIETVTGSDGYISGMAYAYSDGSTDITVYSSGSISDPVQINVSVSAIDFNPENLMVDKYYLYQNYPNPFNPSTTIKYQIPELSFVTLKIYDVLGSEIITLLNEEKPPGNYEVEFSAKGGSASGGDVYNLPSGVYFYQLRAGEFVETKKMLMLK